MLCVCTHTQNRCQLNISPFCFAIYYDNDLMFRIFNYDKKKRERNFCSTAVCHFLSLLLTLMKHKKVSHSAPYACVYQNLKISLTLFWCLKDKTLSNLSHVNALFINYVEILRVNKAWR